MRTKKVSKEVVFKVGDYVEVVKNTSSGFDSGTKGVVDSIKGTNVRVETGDEYRYHNPLDLKLITKAKYEYKDTKINVLESLSTELVKKIGTQYVFGCGEVTLTEKEALGIITLMADTKFYTSFTLAMDFEELHVYDLEDITALKDDLINTLKLADFLESKNYKLIADNLSTERQANLVLENTNAKFKAALKAFTRKSVKKVVAKKKVAKKKK